MLSRQERLVGPEALSRIRDIRVIVFGVGGVGGWCAEALIREGVHRMTIVDSDEVVPSNINRQLVATSRTIGCPKVEVLRERLLEIHPDADITALCARYTPETADSFRLHDYDYVVDAIDSVACKMDLICRVTALPNTRIFSSMGAALKMDPSCVRVQEFWQIQGDPLARALRTRMKKEKRFPARKFTCVYSTEPASQNYGEGDGNGSAVHITATFGMFLASLVIHAAIHPN